MAKFSRTAGGRRRWRAPAAAALALAMLAAACGSTAQQPDADLARAGVEGGAEPAPDAGQPPLPGDGAEDEPFDPGQPEPQGDDGEQAAPPVQSGQSGPAQPSQQPAEQPPPAPGAGGPAQAAEQAGSGQLCTGTVQLGVFYWDPDDAEAAAEAVGASGGENRGVGHLHRAIERLNEAGGLGGCQVEPVWAALRATGNWVRQGEEACARFTQDHRVFAAIILGHAAGRPLMDCLTRAGVVQYWPRTVVFMMTDDDYRRNAGSMYRPDDIGVDRKAFVIDHLREAGYFDPGARLGIVSFEDGTSAREHLVDNVLKPRLAQHGVNVVAEGEFRPVRGLSDVNRMAQDASQIVLRFRTANVTHVLFAGGGASFMFTNVAESQNYNPRYALTSDDELGHIRSQPASQHLDSVVISWQPVFDADTSRSLWPPNPAHDRCVERYGDPDDPNGPLEFPLCDGLEFLRAGLARAPEMSQAGFHAGFAQLGTSFVSAVGLGPTRLGAGRYDGGVAARSMSFDPEIHGWRYTGPQRAVP